MVCKNCGAELNEDILFCTECGTPRDMEVPESTEADYGIEFQDSPKKDPGKGLGITALILGIVALVFGTVCTCAPCVRVVFTIISPIIAIVGIVLGAMAMKKSKAAGFKNTMAMIGLILSIAALVLGLTVATLPCVIGGGSGLLSIITGESNTSYYY